MKVACVFGKVIENHLKTRALFLRGCDRKHGNAICFFLREFEIKIFTTFFWGHTRYYDVEHTRYYDVEPSNMISSWAEHQVVFILGNVPKTSLKHLILL